MKKEVHISVSRGMTFYKNKILLCKGEGKINYFLVGGHIENQENPNEALKREILEETGYTAINLEFITKFINRYETEEHIIYEKNFLFTFDFLNGNKENIESKEKHITFNWIKLSKIKEVELLPKQILPYIHESIHIS